MCETDKQANRFQGVMLGLVANPASLDSPIGLFMKMELFSELIQPPRAAMEGQFGLWTHNYGSYSIFIRKEFKGNKNYSQWMG